MAPQAIPQKLYYPLAEVAEIVGVKAHVLRYWEAEFGFRGPLQKEGNDGGLYSPRDLERALAIKRLLGEGRLSVAAAKRRLREEWGRAREAEPSRADGETPPDPREERRLLLRMLHGEAEELVRILKRR